MSASISIDERTLYRCRLQDGNRTELNQLTHYFKLPQACAVVMAANKSNPFSQEVPKSVPGIFTSM